MTVHLCTELPPIPSNSNGSYRDVYDLGNGTVVKVCRDPAKTNNAANESEYRLWRIVRCRKESIHFARIIDRTRNGSNIMERADSLLEDTVSLLDFDEDRDIDPEVLAAADKYGLKDLHPGNIGIFNGKQKLIDYQTDYPLHSL